MKTKPLPKAINEFLRSLSEYTCGTSIDETPAARGGTIPPAIIEAIIKVPGPVSGKQSANSKTPIA